MINLNKNWITDKIGRDTIEWTETFANDLAKASRVFDRQKNKDITKKAMSTSQLRKFFGEIKRIQALGIEHKDAKNDILMLKPKLAYAVGRDKGESKIDEFYKQISIALDAINVDNQEHFNNFIRIFEAIVAYHKAAGGQ